MRRSAPLVLLLCACAPVSSRKAPAECVPASLDWGQPVTTLTKRIVADAPLETALENNPVWDPGLSEAVEAGLGGWTETEGEPWTVRDDLAPGHVPGENRRSLLLFFHQSDAQIADAESPARLVAADAIGFSESAARPHELYAIHALDALIRTANELGKAVPIDFALATGDDADNAQSNELQWFVDVWDGTRLKPDSGDADQQLDEDCNDPLAEFTPVGADIPWYSVAGNHDVLVQGNFDPSGWTGTALGADAPTGTRDLSEPGAPLAYTSVPEPARALLERSDIATTYLDSPAIPGPVGHGFGEANVTANSVDWVAQPVGGIPVVVIAVDANPPDVGDAAMTLAERDDFLVPALEAAEAAGQLVILTSHYALSDLPVEDGSVLGQTLVQHPNVVLTVAGHTHLNSIRAYGVPDDPGAFWDLRTDSSTDWPGQGRLIELVDNGDGTLSIFTTMFDPLAPAGSMVERERVLSLYDLQGGWRKRDGSGEADDRNTELLQRLPEGWASTAGDPGVRSESLP